MTTDWDARYQTGDTPWDKGAPSPPLVDYLRGHALTGEILVPGCGFGYDVRAIATPQNHVVGLDLAPSAIEHASAFPAAAGEEYRLGDFFEMPDEDETRFDWIWEHTCFCAIDPSQRSDYVRAALRALRPGGHLLGVFYLDPGNDGDGPPFGVSSAELDELFAPGFLTLDRWVPAHAYEGREGREEMRLMVCQKASDAL
jgi:SAM-dependent methyltransferase